MMYDIIIRMKDGVALLLDKNLDEEEVKNKIDSIRQTFAKNRIKIPGEIKARKKQ